MKSLEAALIVLSVLVLGAMDYVTGYDLSFFVFYFIRVVAVAARHGAIAGYAVSVLCAAVWFLSD